MRDAFRAEIILENPVVLREEGLLARTVYLRRGETTSGALQAAASGSALVPGTTVELMPVYQRVSLNQAGELIATGKINAIRTA